MIELLGSIGWGLLAHGAVTHVWHHARLRSLLAAHLDRERFPAFALTLLEAALAVAIPIAWLTRSALLAPLAVVAFCLAAGFIFWIARLLATGSDLPCACSFSEAPTSWWSFARSACVALVVLLAFVSTAADIEVATTVATLLVGWALAAAIFVVPEAVTWPAASTALLARVDAHTTGLDGP